MALNKTQVDSNWSRCLAWKCRNSATIKKRRVAERWEDYAFTLTHTLSAAQDYFWQGQLRVIQRVVGHGDMYILRVRETESERQSFIRTTDERHVSTRLGCWHNTLVSYATKDREEKRQFFLSLSWAQASSLAAMQACIPSAVYLKTSATEATWN